MREVCRGEEGWCCSSVGSMEGDRVPSSVLGTGLGLRTGAERRWCRG